MSTIILVLAQIVSAQSEERRAGVSMKWIHGGEEINRILLWLLPTMKAARHFF